MNRSSTSDSMKTKTLTHSLGAFEGFNFREHSAIEHLLTAEQVVQWDHDQAGEAEFWPAGDHPGVAAVFAGQSSITTPELIALDRLLEELGGDSIENFLRIHHARSANHADLATLTLEQVEDNSPHIFLGTNFTDLRHEAAYELFELYYPEAYAVWEKCSCDGLGFDPDRFLDSPGWSVEEIALGHQVALLIVSQ